jgi:hypothetical protein
MNQQTNKRSRRLPANRRKKQRLLSQQHGLLGSVPTLGSTIPSPEDMLQQTRLLRATAAATEAFAATFYGGAVDVLASSRIEEISLLDSFPDTVSDARSLSRDDPAAAGVASDLPRDNPTEAGAASESPFKGIMDMERFLPRRRIGGFEIEMVA